MRKAVEDDLLEEEPKSWRALHQAEAILYTVSSRPSLSVGFRSLNLYALPRRGWKLPRRK